jgi:hypothetical protein
MVATESSFANGVPLGLSAGGKFSKAINVTSRTRKERIFHAAV